MRAKKLTEAATNANGERVFKGLKPNYRRYRIGGQGTRKITVLHKISFGIKSAKCAAHVSSFGLNLFRWGDIPNTVVAPVDVAVEALSVLPV